jgi:dsRNA-specific ribonuclease
MAVAEGRSKRAAEQEAARRMLSLMPQTVPSPPSKDHS